MPTPANDPPPSPRSATDPPASGPPATPASPVPKPREGDSWSAPADLPPAEPDRLDRPRALLALLTAIVALPVAALVLPHTVSYVLSGALADLGLGASHATGLVRAAGLALPALLLVAPPAALAARRLPAWSVPLIGLLCVLVGALAASEAGSVVMVAVARTVQGAGAGAVVSASLVLVWERRPRVPVAAWAGALVGALVLAMPLALQTVPAAGGGAPGQAGWRSVLHPHLGLIGVALVAVAVYTVTAGRRRGLPAMADTERTQLLLPLVPVGGFAFLAVVTTYDRWSEGALLIVAAIGLVALLGLAIVGTRNATTGGPLRCSVTMVTTGLFVVPVAAPAAGLISTGVEARDVPVQPFAIAAVAALAGAIVTVRLGGDRLRAAVLLGHGLVVLALLILLTVGATSAGGHLTMALVPLCAGAGMALAAALWEAGLSPALFGLALCFPAVLVGYLAVGPLQMIKVNAVRAAGGGRQDLVLALTSAFRLWLIVATVVAVLLTALAALAGRRFLAGDQPTDSSPV